VCTRSCGFCAVDSGVPQPVDIEEPRRAANFVMRLGLKHAVITSVTRDDLEDGGASSFAETVNRIRSMSNNKIPIELLTPDFKGSETALDTVLDSRPDVFNHNIETVEQLQKKVRPQADYRRSLRVLKHAAASGKTKAVKSGIMVGLGEDDEQLFSALNDLLENGCQYLTIGQYLAPSHNHLPVRRFVRPEMFVKYREKALAMGFKKVASAPLVRSSYLAENFLDTCGGNKLHDQ
jgi:lipoic acid synthetase